MPFRHRERSEAISRQPGRLYMCEIASAWTLAMTGEREC